MPQPADEAGDLEGAQDPLGGADEHEVAAARLQVAQGVQQHADAGGVHERDGRQVDHEQALALLGEVQQPAAQPRAR